jgi:hypothetical protein
VPEGGEGRVFRPEPGVHDAVARRRGAGVDLAGAGCAVA